VSLEDELEQQDDLEEIEDDDEEEAVLPAVEGEEEEETSLEELLAQRAAARRGPDEDDDETEDIMALTSERETPVVGEPLPAKIVPIKDRQEFVCNSCHLVKARSQLADEERGLCRDCV
jgi:hypothetical protein